MGMCVGRPKDPTSEAIEQQLAVDRKNAQWEVKLLLLGAGESGKSTIAKQFRILSLGGFTEKEREEYRAFIHGNLLTSTRSLFAASQLLGIPLEPTSKELGEMVTASEVGLVVGPEVGEKLKKFWGDPGVQKVVAQSSEFQLNDNTEYMFANVERISAPGYLPTQDDVLKCRIRTTGVIETIFPLGQRKVVMVDVGGQRAERRKWMGCFSNVTVVIFCVALSEYDLKLAEDGTTNRMEESMKLFEELCNKWFSSTTIILFLNKIDLFKKKIMEVPLSNTFPEYGGPRQDPKAAGQFLREKFQQLDKSEKDDRLFIHYTCATDTSNVAKVFEAVKETLLGKALQNIGLVD